MFNWQVLLYVCLFSLLLIAIYFAIKKKYKFSLTFVLSILILLSVIFVPTIISLVRAMNIEYEYHQIVFEGNLSLAIETEDDRSYLVFEGTNTEVTYINVYEQKPFIGKKLQPIYLKDLGDYYLVIYSPDHTKIINSNRFIQGDYEFFDVDHLVLIQKETGYIIDTQEYELIGKEINLDSFKYVGNVIMFGVFIPYENNISFYRYIVIQDGYSLDDVIQQRENYYSDFVEDHVHGLLHFHTLGDPSEIINFQIAGNYLLIQDSYGDVYVGTYNESTYGLTFNFSDVLSDQEFIKEGYIKVTESGIYYLSNDFNIYRFSYYGNPTLIKADATKDEFINYIFE